MDSRVLKYSPSTALTASGTDSSLGLIVTSLILDRSSMPRKLLGEQLDDRPSQPVSSRNLCVASHYCSDNLLASSKVF